MRRLLFLGALFICGCGESPTAPTASLAGVYAGTFSSSNWSPRAATLTLQATGSGTWDAQGWRGDVDLTRTGDALAGRLTITMPASIDLQVTCTATSEVTGTIDGGRLELRAPGFSGPCTALPLEWRLRVSR